VRFAPFPGFTFGGTWFGRSGKANVAKTAVSANESGLSSSAGVGTAGRILQPTIGANVTFMSFGAARDFNPVTNQFSATNGSNFEIGAGPLFGLFNNRLSVTFGWNLMQPAKRLYWGLGFGFVSIGKDLAGFLKKN
jgi:hypothetical protein